VVEGEATEKPHQDDSTARGTLDYGRGLPPRLVEAGAIHPDAGICADGRFRSLLDQWAIGGA